MLVMLGSPGSGKGTQAARLAAYRNLMHLSTGDLLRNALREKSELGLKARTFMDKGNLVPDDLILEMIRKVFAEGKDIDGVIFDGFPRTIPQAESLGTILDEENSELDLAFNLNISDDEVVKRLSGRYSCPDCQKTYNYPRNLPKVPGRCDDCQGILQRREDDTEKVVRNRLEVYKKQTEPLLGYYESKSILKNIDGEREIEAIFHDLVLLTDDL